MKKKTQPVNWEHFSDEELLQMRIRDFSLSIPGSPLESLIENLYEELDAKGITFHPACYLADEWLCPDGEPIIGIPFFLAHPRLKHIEEKMMFEVEGGTEASCMKLLRHESGHAINYAYGLYKKTRWRQLFGSYSSRYSNTYHFQPYSKRYVVHLDDHYAQAHPDEDFAETFAVWLTPDISWERKYRDWPAIKKLRYVDGLAKKISNEPPIRVSQDNPPWSASRMTSTLSAYYERKRKLLGEEFKGFYDDSLKKLFSQKSAAAHEHKASRILRQHRLEIVENVSRWTGHRKYDIHQLVSKLIRRCDLLEVHGEEKDLIGVATLITAIADSTLGVPKGNRQ